MPDKTTERRFDMLLKAMAEGEPPSASKEPKREPDAQTFRHTRPKPQ